MSWLARPLSEIADVRLGRQRAPKNHRGDSMRPYLRAANVTWDGLNLDDVKTMNFTDSELETYRLQPGDIVLGEASGSRDEVGKPALWRGEIADCAFQNTLIRVRPREHEPTFLLHFLRYQALSGKFAERSRGVGIHHLGRARLASWPVPLPPLSEQHHIVEILEDHLSRLDAAEASLIACDTRARNLSSKIIDYSQSVEIGSDGEALSPSDADVVDGQLPLLPAAWRWGRLGEIADVAGGITKDSKKQNDPSLPLHPYLRVANVQAGRLDLDHVTEIRTTPAQVEKLTLRSGDVLLNEGGDRDKLGRGWIWEDQLPNCLHQNHVFRARVLDDAIDPRLIAWHANSFGRSWFMANGKQSVNLASVSLRTIRAFPVPIPPRGLQTSIVNRIAEGLASLDRLRSSIRDAQTRSAALRLSLLRTAFNGELVDRHLDYESADIPLLRLGSEVKPS